MKTPSPWNCVRARLGDDVHRRAGGPSELGVESVREYGDFLHRSDRHRDQRRLTSPPFIVGRAVEHERRGAAAAGSGDEVRRIDEEIARALALAECGVEQRQRRDLASEDRRLVDRLAVEPPADLRIRTDALDSCRTP
jgi:hypothetical protein